MTTRKRRIGAIVGAFLALVVMPGSARAQGVADPLLTTAVFTLQGIAAAGYAGAEIALSDIYLDVQQLSFLMQPATGGAIPGAVTGSQTLEAEFWAKHADYTAGNMQTSSNLQNAARYQADAMMPSQSTACAVQGYLQGFRQMMEDAHGVSGAFTSLVALGECKGVLANCHGPSYVREKIYDLCYLGFVPPSQNGDMFGPNGMNCPDISVQYPGALNGQRYIDAHNNMALLIDTIQMPIAPFCILPDGYPYFSGTLPPGVNVACVGGTTLQKPGYQADPSVSQMAWVAAYKFCEGLADPPTTPIYTVQRVVTDIDYAAWLADQHRNVLESNGSPRKLCMEYLWERTAFPIPTPDHPTPTFTAVDSNQTAAQDQANLCQILFNSPNPGQADTAGMNGAAQTLAATGLGYGASDPLVQNCANNGTGLSYLAMKMDKHYRCGDTGYLPNYAEAQGKHDNVEKNVQGDCVKEADTFQEFREHERAALTHLIARSRQIAEMQAEGIDPRSIMKQPMQPNIGPGGSPVTAP